MEKTRIATVKATGKRYIVDQLDFRANKAHVWGEVTSVTAKGAALQTRHDGRKAFLLDAVTIAEVDRTQELLRGLFDQGTQGLRDKGHVLEERTARNGGKRVTDLGTPAQIEARREANERFVGFLEETGLGEAFRALGVRSRRRR